MITFDANKRMNPNAFHEGHSDEEKAEWCWEVSHMTTINSIKKDELQTALRWLIEYCVNEED